MISLWAGDKYRKELGRWLAAVRGLLKMLQSTKTKSIMGIIVVALAILGFFGIKIFDITISDFLWSIINVGKESETQTAESQLSFSDVGNETETGIKQLSPINEANKEPETQSPPQQTDADETKTLEFSRLMGILKDLGSYPARLSFIKTNIDLMPASLSLDELHRILALFGRYDYKSTVIQIFLSRLPDSLSLSELNRMLALFGRYDYRLTVTRIFLSRLRADYSESDFNTYKKHYGSISYKQQAIELLLRKNQKQ